jgi:hypothetical protein
MNERLPAGLAAILALAIGVTGLPCVSGEASAASKAVASEGTPTTYAELEHHVGEQIVVETTFDTVRRGVLTGYTTYSLEMKLGPEAGSFDLTVPADTVRSVRVIGPDTTITVSEGGSAKKN